MPPSLHQANFKIAEKVLRITSENEGPITQLKQGFPSFLSTQKPDLAAVFTFQRSWRKKTDPFLSPSAVWQANKFFCRQELFDARIDFARQKAEFLSGDPSNIGVMFRFLCSTILAKAGGLLLHSCAILEKGSAYVFFGPSESGKTTIARISNEKTVLTDETTALLRKCGAWFAYATPFAGEFGQPRQNNGGPIKAMFALNKDSRFRHYLKKPGGAARELSRSVLLNNADFGMIQRTLASLESLASSVPCYDLHFKAQPRIWRYLRGFVQ
jgi:hypothetical protein